MKIIYQENPLKSKVELNHNDKKKLFSYIKQQEYKNLLITKQYNNKSLISNTILNKNAHQTMLLYIDALLNNHQGDCTCMSFSCTKCAAEYFFEIDTIKGLSKQCAHKIHTAFNLHETTSIEQAIQYLSIFSIDPEKFNTKSWKDIGGYEQYVPRWKQEQEQAYQWLINYKKNFLCTKNLHSLNV